jgi:hypothetical protein
MNNSEQIYNKALEMLKKGRSKEEVLLEFPEHKAELEPLLEISSMLFLMPKNNAPEPAMRRKYILAPAKHVWFAWIHISKFAGVSMSVMLLLSALTVAGHTALNSQPGQNLFAVKKSAEQLELLLASSQDKKADLQVAIAQKRLSEAQAIFSDPSSGPDQKNAVLNELAAQTSTAVAQVSSVAKSDPKAATNNPLLNSLDSITKQQQTLLSEIKPEDSKVTDAAQSALKELDKNTAEISQIKQSVAVATADQSLASLSSDPNVVAVIGEITQLGKDQITVEKTAFVFDSQTAIINSASGTASSTLAFSQLSLKMKVSISGVKNDKTIVARQVLVLANSEPQGIVKGDSTTTTSTTVSTKKPEETLSEEPTSTTSTAPQINPNAARGSFILEDPSPQYVK